MAKILFIGGSRSFGLQAAHQLVEAGHELVQVHRSAAKIPGRSVIANRGNYDGLAEALEGESFDVIIDAAASSGEDVRFLAGLFPDATYVLQSTAAVHIQEPPTPHLIEYVSAKLEAEVALEDKHDVRILRLGLVIEPQDPRRRLVGFRTKRMMVCDPQAQMRLIHGEDAAEGIVRSLDWPPGSYELAGAPRSIQFLADLVDAEVFADPGQDPSPFERAAGLPPVEVASGGPDWEPRPAEEWFEAVVKAEAF